MTQTQTAKHTAGPWTAEGNVIVDFDGQQIASVLEDHVNGVHEYDAKLIAAAPDLLEVLESVVEFLNNGTPVCSGSDLHAEARAAIQKATA